MEKIFVSENLLLGDGLTLLAHKSSKYTVVVTDRQKQGLRERANLYTKDFDAIWTQLEEKAGVRVETYPEIPPDVVKDLQTRFGADFDRVKEMISSKFRKKSDRVKAAITRQRDQMPGEIAAIQRLAASLNTAPRVLADALTGDYFRFDGLELITEEEFHKDAAVDQDIRLYAF
jgi:hypothetical protein